jgi:hypothetical protein
VRKGNHGREIRCMAVRQAESGDLLLASGSEDTYINFTQGTNIGKTLANVCPK